MQSVFLGPGLIILDVIYSFQLLTVVSTDTHYIGDILLNIGFDEVDDSRYNKYFVFDKVKVKADADSLNGKIRHFKYNFNYKVVLFFYEQEKFWQNQIRKKNLIFNFVILFFKKVRIILKLLIN